MAGTMSTASISEATLSCTIMKRQRTSNVVFIKGLNSFGGLKAQNQIASLGVTKCSEQSFSMVVKNSLKRNGKSKGGALTSTCNAAEEIFKIAAIMNGLTLIGVAVGFVLLRIEATLEEEE